MVSPTHQEQAPSQQQYQIIEEDDCRPAILDRFRNRLSLYQAAWWEAERHKWIESQKRGYDVGDPAIREWYSRYWPCFCRFRRLEHLEGRQFWVEFEEDRFGFFYDLLLQGDPLLLTIMDQIGDGRENLDIINWVLDHPSPYGSADDLQLMNHVIAILEAIDINRVRLDPAY